MLPAVATTEISHASWSPYRRTQIMTRATFRAWCGPSFGWNRPTSCRPSRAPSRCRSVTCRELKGRPVERAGQLHHLSPELTEAFHTRLKLSLVPSGAAQESGDPAKVVPWAEPEPSQPLGGLLVPQEVRLVQREEGLG